MGTEALVDQRRAAGLPFDGSLSRGVAVYRRRVEILLNLAVSFVTIAISYAAYRFVLGWAPAWIQIGVPFAALFAVYATIRWREYREVPTALDQLVGCMLLAVAFPAVLQTRYYAKRFPRMYEQLFVVGRKGRVITAVDYRRSADERIGAVQPSFSLILSLLPAIAVGSVRFRGRPLMRLSQVCTAGPISLKEFGRAPGIFAAYTRSTDTPSEVFATRLATVWERVAARGCRPNKSTVVVLVHVRATMYREEEHLAGTPRAHTVRFKRDASVLLPFVVPPDEEKAVRREIRREMQSSDVLVGRGDRLPALLRTAWLAWGNELDPREEMEVVEPEPSQSSEPPKAADSDSPPIRGHVKRRRRR